jgi:endonuclease/exonuclease/phosphatase family metal-dependent hydrolase
MEVLLLAYRIGSFNCLSFGSGRDEKARFIAQIIAEERFDIVALQEIKNSGAMKLLLCALKNYPGDWQGDCDEWGSADYGFVWNTKRVRLVRVKNRNGERTVYPHTVTAKGASRVLARAPYCARFEPCSPGVPKFEIRVINTHIRYGRQKSDNELVEQGIVALRKAEYMMLMQTVYPAVAGKSIIDNMSTDDCRPIYTVMLGDYNLNKRASGAKSPYLEDKFVCGRGGRQKVIVTEQSDLTTLKQPASAPESDAVQSPTSFVGYANNYDHVTYDQVRFDGIGLTYGSVDAVGKYLDGNAERYREEVSDHIPIFLSIELKRR